MCTVDLWTKVSVLLSIFGLLVMLTVKMDGIVNKLRRRMMSSK
jgi:hypothetical protein